MDIARLCDPQLLLLTHMVPAPDSLLLRKCFLYGLQGKPHVRAVIGDDGLVARVRRAAGGKKAVVEVIQSSWRSARRWAWLKDAIPSFYSLSSFALLLSVIFVITFAAWFHGHV